MTLEVYRLTLFGFGALNDGSISYAFGSYVMVDPNFGTTGKGG